MKNIFSPHVREVHIVKDRTLRLRVTGIGQVIDALSFISASLKILGPMNPEASIKLGEEGCGGIELVEISYIPKEKAHHKNVYIVNLTPKLRSATTLIFNEDDTTEVDKRLKHLINRFSQESKSRPNPGYWMPPKLSPGLVEMQSRGRSRDPNQKVEVYILPLDGTKCPATGQMLGRLKPLKEVNITKLIGEPMECRDGSYYSSEAYLRQRELLLGRKKESE